ncbi:MAG: MFS transporter [Candidatus Aminicenantes bacterium]|nr:MFS transporter [Candidatus Aminicenantes bacterium]
MSGADGRLFRLLKRAVDIRPEETGVVVRMFFHFFLITFTAYVIKPVKLSLYLTFLTADRLPYAYLLTALLMGLAVSLNSRLLSRLNRRAYISWSLLFFMGNLLVFRWLFGFHWPWVSMLFWFWSDLFIVTAVMQFWMAVNDRFHPRQARRLVGFFVSGGLWGGVAGALVASRLVRLIGTENLLLVCPAFLAGAFVLVRHRDAAGQPEESEAAPENASAPKKTGYAGSFRILRRSRYLRLLAALVAAGIVVTTLVDFQFSSAVEAALPLKDARTSFLGTFFLGLLVFSTLLHHLLSGRILKRYGILAALIIPPAVLFLGSAAVFFVPAGSLLWWAVPVKGLDKSLTHTINQSVRELLYIPVPADEKYKAKAFIDMFVNKFADGLAAVMLLALPLSLKGVSGLTAFFCLAWAALAALITKEYAEVVKRHLKIQWEDADRLILDRIDVDTTQLVFDTLESRGRSSVLYAMNLYELIRRERLTPELRKIIAQRSGELRAGAMDSLLDVDGEPLFPDTDDVLPEETLDAQVREILDLGVYRQVMGRYLEDVAKEAGPNSETARMEAAKALGLMDPGSPLARNLAKFLRDESPEVAVYALRSAGQLKRRDLLPPVLSCLSRPALSQAAVLALTEYGDRIVGALKDYLADPEEDLRIRRLLPDVLARIGTQRAADALLSEFRKAGSRFEAELIEALAKLKVSRPEIRFDETVVLEGVKRQLRTAYGDLERYHDLKPGGKKEGRRRDLELMLFKTVKSIFALLGLIYPPEDIRRAYQNLLAGTKKAIDYSVELLDSLLHKDIKPFLLPMVEDLPLDEKAKSAGRILKALNKASAS